MAEKPKTNLPPIQRSKPKAVKLSPEKRLKRVLGSQGSFQTSAVEKLPADVREALTALCSEDGTLEKDTRAKSQAILDKFYDSQKATVDKPAKAAPGVK